MRRYAPRWASLEQKLHFQGITITESGCWETGASKDRQGYGYFRFKGKFIKSHRAAYAVWVGGLDANLQVLHSCDNPPCIYPPHLSLGTNADNVADRVAKGRSRGKGSK